jgi:methyl-accepting chemotaxis protein
MDPLSIATASASLAGFCVKLSTIIYNFIDKSQHVERTVQVLRVEIDSLSQVLTSISVNFNDHSLAETALDSQTGHEAQHWKNFEGLMDDCKETLEALEHVLEPMKKKSRPFARPVKQFKLEQMSREIELLKQQIAAYRQTMSLSLQLITVYPPFLLNLIKFFFIK